MGLKYNDVRIETVIFFEGLQNPKMSDDLHKLSCYVDRHEEVHTNPSLLSGNTQIHYPHTHTHSTHNVLSVQRAVGGAQQTDSSFQGGELLRCM